jgi:hypothetical protein
MTDLFTYGAELFTSRQLCSHSRTCQHFMEPEVSLSCSQESFTGPYPEPDRSTQCQEMSTVIKFSNIIYSYTEFEIFEK